MPELHLIHISDTHLTRRRSSLTDNFHRVSEYIDAKRPDLVVNSGDLAFDAPTGPDDLEFSKTLHDTLPVAWRCIPGNHDIGDNPANVGPPPSQPVTEPNLHAYRAIFGDDRWQFDAAGWCFIGLNSLVMNSGLADEAEQFDWLASQLSQTQRQAAGVVSAQAALPEFTWRSRTRGDIYPIHSNAAAETPAGDARSR